MIQIKDGVNFNNLHCTQGLTCSNVKGSVAHGYRLTFAGQWTQNSSGLDLCAPCEKSIKHLNVQVITNIVHLDKHSITNPHLINRNGHHRF